MHSLTQKRKLFLMVVYSFLYLMFEFCIPWPDGIFLTNISDSIAVLLYAVFLNFYGKF